jgi:hypothetical protein
MSQNQPTPEPPSPNQQSANQPTPTQPEQQPSSPDQPTPTPSGQSSPNQPKPDQPELKRSANQPNWETLHSKDQSPKPPTRSNGRLVAIILLLLLCLFPLALFIFFLACNLAWEY